MATSTRVTPGPDHPPRGLPPPAAAGPASVRGAAADRAAPAASRQHRPTSQRVPAVEVRCEGCGFAVPTRGEMAAALRAVPPAWHAALQTRPELAENAAVVRDVLHATANRAGRLLAEPGVRLSMVHINAPFALARTASAAQLAEVLEESAARLADLADALEPDQWHLAGCMGDATVTIADLIAGSLHRSHAALDGGAAVLSYRRDEPLHESEGAPCTPQPCVGSTVRRP
jgi:hypothetical protein